MSIPYPRPEAAPSALDLALRELARTVTEEEWNAEIRRRTIALMRWRGETFLSLAARGGHGHSYFAKKLGEAITRPFTLDDLAEVLLLLDAPPALLLDPPAPPVKEEPPKGPGVDHAKSDRADFVDEVIEPYRHLLGTMSDAKLAQLIGCAKGRVFRARRRLGIAGTPETAYRFPARNT